MNTSEDWPLVLAADPDPRPVTPHPSTPVHVITKAAALKYLSGIGIAL